MPEEGLTGAAAPTEEPSFREQVEQAEQSQPTESSSADAEPPAAAAPEEGETTVVRLGALQEERRRRQEYQRAAEEAQRNFLVLQQQQLQVMAELQRREQAARTPPPSREEDPLGYVAHATEQTQAELNQMRRAMYEQQQQAQQQQVTQSFIASVTAAEAAHAAQVPDSREAVQYLRERKWREYVAAGMDEQSASAAVDRDGWALAQSCLARGENPAQRAYEIAKALGYRRRSATPQDQVAMQAAGARASTPSGTAGAGGGRVSLDVLAKMSPDEFLKATSGDKWRKLMSNQ